MNGCRTEQSNVDVKNITIVNCGPGLVSGNFVVGSLLPFSRDAAGHVTQKSTVLATFFATLTSHARHCSVLSC